MGVGAAEEIEANLRAEGLAAQTVVQIIENAQRPDQRVETCRGDQLTQCLQNANIQSPAILSFELMDAAESKPQRLKVA